MTNLMKLIWALCLAALGGVLYHCGGLDKDGPEEPWIPAILRNSWVRDWLLPAVSLGILFLWWRPSFSWKLVLACAASYFLMALALTTYWDWINKLFGQPEDEKRWYNWFVHGFCAGAAFYPLAWFGIHWWAVTANALASGILCMWVSERTAKARREEYGRGIAVTISRLLLFI